MVNISRAENGLQNAWKYLTESTAVATGKDLGSMSEEEKIQMLKDNYGEDIIDSKALEFLKNLTEKNHQDLKALKDNHKAFFYSQT